MATIYGATLVQSPMNEANARYDIIGKNSEQFTVGDCVSMASGVLEVTSAATLAIAGVVLKSQTMASNNQTVQPILYPGFQPADENDVWLMGTNSDLTGNATDYGTFYGITGTTGAQLVNVSAGVTTTTSRQVMIVKVDPFGIGGSGSGSGLRQVLVKFIRVPEFNGAFN